VKRNPYYDNARFLLILLVVTGHVIAYMKTESVFLRSVFAWVHLFHMPMFVLISGRFSSPEVSWRTIRKNVGRLIVPYLIFQTAALILVSLRDGRIALDYHLPRNVLWYLVSLFCWRAMLPVAVRFRWAFPTSILASLLCGYCPFAGWHFSLSRTIVFFPFFLAGYYLRDGLQQSLRNVLSARAAIAVLVTTFAVSPFVAPVSDCWFFGATSYAAMGHTEWYAAGYRALVVAGAFLVGGSCMRLVPGSMSSVTTHGSRTLYVFLLHDMIVLTALKYAGLFRLFNGALQESMGVVSLSILITLFLSSRFITRLTRPVVDPLAFMGRIKVRNSS